MMTLPRSKMTVWIILTECSRVVRQGFPWSKKQTPSQFPRTSSTYRISHGISYDMPTRQIGFDCSKDIIPAVGAPSPDPPKLALAVQKNQKQPARGAVGRKEDP